MIASHDSSMTSLNLTQHGGFQFVCSYYVTVISNWKMEPYAPSLLSTFSPFLCPPHSRVYSFSLHHRSHGQLPPAPFKFDAAGLAIQKDDGSPLSYTVMLRPNGQAWRSKKPKRVRPSCDQGGQSQPHDCQCSASKASHSSDRFRLG